MSVVVLPPLTGPEMFPGLLSGAHEMALLFTHEAEATTKRRADGRPGGPTTGLATIDKEIGGFLRPGLYVIHGEPGSGKTALALQIAGTCRTAAVFCTTEMAPMQLWRRHVARVARKPLDVVMTGRAEFSDELTWSALARDSAPWLNFLDATTEAMPRDLLIEAVKLAKGSHQEHCLLVVDSLHSWSAPLAAAARVTEYEALNQAMADLRFVASECGVPILLLAERNRSSMKDASQSSVAGTRRVEYGCDVMIALKHDDDNSESALKGIHARIVKNRNGRTGYSVPLTFQPETMTFTEPTSWRAQ